MALAWVLFERQADSHAKHGRFDLTQNIEGDASITDLKGAD